MANEAIALEYDDATKEWFKTRPGYCTTVTKCEFCGLYYKPSLGHKCKKVDHFGPQKVGLDHL